MRKRILLAILPVVAVIFEALPYGAVLRFASEAERIDIHTYSYFDLTPYGYANFGPLLTAILTVIILILALIYVFLPKKKLKSAITVVSLIAVITSLMPLMFGVAYFTPIAVVITVLLFCEVIASILNNKNKTTG